MAIELFLIMGKSASGKDYITKELALQFPDQINIIKQYTTRPMRKEEENGREYYFVSKEEMKSMIHNGDIIECRHYDTYHETWYYFTAKDNQFLEGKKNLIITTIVGAKSILEYFKLKENITIRCIYIYSDGLTRMQRSLTRLTKKSNSNIDDEILEICRRYLSDEKDFTIKNLQQLNDLIDYYHLVSNNPTDNPIHEMVKVIFNQKM